MIEQFFTFWGHVAALLAAIGSIFFFAVIAFALAQGLIYRIWPPNDDLPKSLHQRLVFCKTCYTIPCICDCAKQTDKEQNHLGK